MTTTWNNEPETTTRMSRMHLSDGEWQPEEGSPAWWRNYVAERVHLRGTGCRASSAASQKRNPALGWDDFKLRPVRCRQCEVWAKAHLPGSMWLPFLGDRGATVPQTSEEK